LFKAGEAGESLYILRRGAVSLEGQGRRQELRPPSHFGEMAALTGEPRAQTARIAEDSELIVIDSRSFRSLLLRNPFLAMELAKTLSDPPSSNER
jgi:CRP-like cAMP-binding protein